MPTSAIDLVRLGNTDLRVTPLGIGTWSWGDSMVWGYGKGYAEADLKTAFDATLASGITFFDTAEIYGWGKSERFLGKFIRESGQKAIVATKFFPFPWRLRKGALVKALRRSLDRLGMAQVDLYQIHWAFPPVAIETWMDGLADAVQAGLTKAVGVSNYNVEQTRRAHAALAKRAVPLASNQVQYSLLCRDPERTGLLKTCNELGVTLIAYSPLAMGMLTGKYTPDNPPSGTRARRYNRAYLSKIQPLVGHLKEIGSAHGKTPSQVALNWVICKGAVPIPGAKDARQAADNAAALGWRLTPDEVVALDQASDAIR
jgi:aryl-alcohol dehydrogenase-like predicted oxidoreductase